MEIIRVGFLGLSKSGWGASAHLPYLKASDKYEIVAVCNSSVESAKESIKLYSLPDSTKAYGDPNDLASDLNVDLVVCSVRVDRHLPTISPSLKAGKDVFVEWPLGKNLQEAEELLRLKNEGKVMTAVVGLQARQAPIIKKLTELVKVGRIGKVLSSTWSAQAGNDGVTVPEVYEYMGRKEVGGNLVTIHFAHSIDYIQQVLGYGFSSTQSILANQRPFVTLLNSEGKVVLKQHPKTSDDTIFVQGALSSGAILSICMRGGRPFKDTAGLEWRIYGEKGEIRVVAPGPLLSIGYPDMNIFVHDFEKNEVEKVEFDSIKGEDAIITKQPIPAQNVARVYDAFAKGENNCTFEDAVERHRFLTEIYMQNGYEY